MPIDIHSEIENGNVFDVEPSNNLFFELGNNAYDFLDLISELIDNSIAAGSEGNLLQIEIEIGFSEQAKEESYLLIRDNAKGISALDIGKALSPGGTSGGESLNEHGLGMKQAIASLGTLKYLATKTSKEKSARVITEIKFGKIIPKLIEVPWPQGTEICVTSLNAIVPRSHNTYSTRYKSYLGARYRRFLRPENPKLRINIRILDLDDPDREGSPTELLNVKVDEVKQIYFHPNSRKNKPVLEGKAFKGVGWKALMTFGYAPTKSEYEELNIEPPKQYEPYNTSLGKQGLDIFKDDRVIQFHQLSEIDLVSTKHNSYNLIRGEIDLISGFKTAITKNSTIRDEHFTELITAIKEFLTEKNLLVNKTYPDELPEALLRDRLAAHLKARKENPAKDVKTELVVGKLAGSIDIVADGLAWELKTRQANGLDVYQLFAYLDMGEIEQGYLVAPNFATGAQEAVDFISKKHKKRITLVPMSDYPINHQPTDEDLKNYY